MGSSRWSPMRLPLIYNSYKPAAAMYARADLICLAAEKIFLKYGAGLIFGSRESPIQAPFQLLSVSMPVSKLAMAETDLVPSWSQDSTFQKYFVNGRSACPA